MVAQCFHDVFEQLFGGQCEIRDRKAWNKGKGGQYELGDESADRDVTVACVTAIVTLCIHSPFPSSTARPKPFSRRISIDNARHHPPTRCILLRRGPGVYFTELTHLVSNTRYPGLSGSFLRDGGKQISHSMLYPHLMYSRQALLDFSRPFDVSLIDKVAMTFYTGVGQEVRARLSKARQLTIVSATNGAVGFDPIRRASRVVDTRP
jgi:hypothetical protein